MPTADLRPATVQRQGFAQKPIPKATLARMRTDGRALEAASLRCSI
jgi:hypothetical protein